MTHPGFLPTWGFVGTEVWCLACGANHQRPSHCPVKPNDGLVTPTSLPPDTWRDDWRIPKVFSSRVQEAMAMLERAERFVYEVEMRDIDPETAIPNLAHAPAIATARSDLRNEIDQLREALGRIRNKTNWLKTDTEIQVNEIARTALNTSSCNQEEK